MNGIGFNFSMVVRAINRYRLPILGLFIVGLVILGMLIFVGYRFEIQPQEVFSGFLSWLERSHWWWLICTIIFCPLVGLPISPFYVLAGFKFGVVGAIFITVLCLIVHFVLAYILSAWVCRGLILKWMQKQNAEFSLPVIPQKDEVKWILFLRIAPGIPMVVQNYTLGLARVRFLPYMIFSMLVQIVYAAAFILFGTAVFSGVIGKAILGVAGAIALLILLNLVGRYVRREFNFRNGLET
jgi:uncharacterized membrane protein YdjX (TVP38/TMEM64 family)